MILSQASPDSASSAQHTRYQTEVLSLLMEHLLAADVLVGDQAALPIVFGGAANNVAPNVCYLAARVVDKLWQGEITGTVILYSLDSIFHQYLILIFNF